MAKHSMTWFTKYWDDVIDNWFSTQIEPNQQLFLNEKSLNLNPKHMPEPYWGDPENCSIVIANYNPGGGADRNRHTYKDCENCPSSFINEVKKKKRYYEVVKDFPIIDDSKGDYNPLANGICWWKEFGGRKWWLQKMKRLQEYTNLQPENRVDIYKKKPFAIEFCAWHSVQWPTKSCEKIYKNNTNLASVIDRYFVKALVDAVHNSDTRLGICVGSQFYSLFDYMSQNNQFVKYVSSTQNASNPNINIHLFKIDGENIIVLWGKGRNRYPKIPPTVQLP